MCDVMMGALGRQAGQLCVSQKPMRWDAAGSRISGLADQQEKEGQGKRRIVSEVRLRRPNRTKQNFCPFCPRGSTAKKRTAHCLANGKEEPDPGCRQTDILDNVDGPAELSDSQSVSQTDG